MSTNLFLGKDYYVDGDERIKGPRGFEMNGTMSVTRCFIDNMADKTNEKIVRVVFKVKISDKVIEKVSDIPFSDLSKKSILKYIPCEVTFIGTEQQMQKFLRDAISRTIIDMDPVYRYILQQGLNKIDNHRVFALGDLIITNSDKNLFVNNSSYQVKKHANDKDYMSWIFNFCQLGKECPALIIASLIAYLRPLYADAGFKGIGDFSVVYYGETGRGKTEVIKLITGIYKNEENIVSLASEKEAIFKLSQFRHCNVVVDDLHTTDSGRVRKESESKVSTLLHQKSSGGSIKYKGKEAKIDSMLFITAEYLLKNHSTLNRALNIEASHIDMNKLSWLQKTQELYVEFVVEFIKWICSNYGDLILAVKNYAQMCKPARKIDSNVYSGANRIQYMKLGLDITFKLFLQFIFGNEKMIELNKKHFDCFQQSIDQCVTDTLHLVQKYSSDYNRDYIDVIIDAIVYGASENVGYCYKEYKKSRKQKEIDKGHTKMLFFIEDDHICITGDDLLYLFEGRPNFEYKVSKKAISNQLFCNGLLSVQGKEYSYPRNKSKRSTSTRFYHIRISGLTVLMDFDQKELFKAVLRDLDRREEFDYCDKYGDDEECYDEDHEYYDDEYSYYDDDHEYDDEDYEFSEEDYDDEDED